MRSSLPLLHHRRHPRKRFQRRRMSSDRRRRRARNRRDIRTVFVLGQEAGDLRRVERSLQVVDDQTGERNLIARIVKKRQIEKRQIEKGQKENDRR